MSSNEPWGQGGPAGQGNRGGDPRRQPSQPGWGYPPQQGQNYQGQGYQGQNYQQPGPPQRPNWGGPGGQPPRPGPGAGRKKPSPLLLATYGLIGVLVIVLAVVGILMLVRKPQQVAEPPPAPPTPVQQSPVGSSSPSASPSPSPSGSSTPVPGGDITAVLDKRNFTCGQIVETPIVINCFKTGSHYAAFNYQVDGDAPIALELWGYAKYPTDTDAMFDMLVEASVWESSDASKLKKALRAKLPQTVETGWGEVTIAKNGEYFYTTASKSDEFPERVEQGTFGGTVKATVAKADELGLTCKTADGLSTCSGKNTTIWISNYSGFFTEVKGQWGDEDGRGIYLDVLRVAAEGDTDSLIPPVDAASSASDTSISTAAGFAYACYPRGSSARFCSVWSPGWWVGN